MFIKKINIQNTCQKWQMSFTSQKNMETRFSLFYKMKLQFKQVIVQLHR